jgi:RNA polymerase sigma factor (TIGR02999 family)
MSSGNLPIYLGPTMTAGPVTEIFRALGRGDPRSAERLLPLVYDELRKLAAARLAHERPGQTLDATALVHEAYLRLAGSGPEGGWDNRGHFFAAAAEAMRRILIDNARRKKADKHGGGLQRLELMETELAVDSTGDELFAVDEALARLAGAEPEIARLVELRIYAGLSLDDAAGLMDLSRRTAYRHWAYARAWLRRELDRQSSQ